MVSHKLGCEGFVKVTWGSFFLFQCLSDNVASFLLEEVLVKRLDIFLHRLEVVDLSCHDVNHTGNDDKEDADVED